MGGGQGLGDACFKVERLVGMEWVGWRDQQVVWACKLIAGAGPRDTVLAVAGQPAPNAWTPPSLQRMVSTIGAHQA